MAQPSTHRPLAALAAAAARRKGAAKRRSGGADRPEVTVPEHARDDPPAGYRHAPSGLLIPGGQDPQRGRSSAARRWVPAAVVGAVIAAGAAIYTAERAARSALQSVICTSALAERRDALAAGRTPPPDVEPTIEHCLRSAGSAPRPLRAQPESPPSPNTATRPPPPQAVTP